MPQSLDFYRQQSCFSTPEPYADLYNALPDTLPDLCKTLQGLFVHYRSSRVTSTMKDRLPQVNLRYISKILAQTQTLDATPLSRSRPIDKRFIGCCRDMALLLCSVLRHRGIPARVRVGFARYIPPQPPFAYTDHVITEYWNQTEERWKRVDAEQSEDLIQQNNVTFDVLNIPPEEFITGGDAWKMGRANPELWDTFGVNDNVKGRWFVASYLIYDLAALNRHETLLWDSWGMMKNLGKLSDEDLEFLDRLANLTTAETQDFNTIRDIYTSTSGLTLPDRIMQYSPVSDWTELTLDCAGL